MKKMFIFLSALMMVAIISVTAAKKSSWPIEVSKLPNTSWPTDVTKLPDVGCHKLPSWPSEPSWPIEPTI